jgi:hypothetical protein
MQQSKAKVTKQKVEKNSTKVEKKLPYSSSEVIPKNNRLEDYGFASSNFNRLLDILRLQSGYKPPKKLKIPNVHKDTFQMYFLEQQRLMQQVEVKYLRKTVAGQKMLVNKLASAVRKYEKKISIYSQAEKRILAYYKADSKGANLPKYKMSYDLKKLRSNVENLTTLIEQLRERHDKFIEFNRKDRFKDIFLDKKKRPPSYYERPKAA